MYTRESTLIMKTRVKFRLIFSEVGSKSSPLLNKLSMNIPDGTYVEGNIPEGFRSRILRKSEEEVEKMEKKVEEEKRYKMQMSIDVKTLLPIVYLPGAIEQLHRGSTLSYLAQPMAIQSILSINYIFVGVYLFRNRAKLLLAALQTSKTETGQLSSN